MTPSGSPVRQLLLKIRHVSTVALAVVGLACLAGRPIARLGLGWMFERTEVRKLVAPGGGAEAVLEVTHGGLGTVWTTRVLLRRKGGGVRMIYEARDSAFEPALSWRDADTLTVGLPCKRIDHLSNPDWPSPDRAGGRLRVRFYYPEVCR